MTPRTSSRRAPDFLIIGAMKAGTTTLYSDLRSQRSIFMPTVKEPADLVSPEIYTNEGLARYVTLFAGSRPSQVCGEASTHYTQLPVHRGAAEAARRVCGPDLRLVYVLRDPLERALSHHRHLFLRGLCTADLHTALVEHPEMVHYSRYDLQLEPWLQEFPTEQIALVSFEHYVSARESTVAMLLGFLGAEVNPDWRPGPAKNTSDERRQPSRAMRWVSQHRGLSGRVARRAPQLLRQPARRLLSRKVDMNSVTVSPEAISELRDALAMVPGWMKDVFTQTLNKSFSSENGV